MRTEGMLWDYFEAGCEGVTWIVSPDTVPEGEDPRNHMVCLQAGDRLEIVSPETGEIVFEGRIDEDDKIGWSEYPMNKGYGQPVALGMYVHWTQRGFQPDDWARFFVREEGEFRYLAVVERDDVPTAPAHTDA